jgi:autotransporter-associated beta strand protein
MLPCLRVSLPAGLSCYGTKLTIYDSGTMGPTARRGRLLFRAVRRIAWPLLSSVLPLVLPVLCVVFPLGEAWGQCNGGVTVSSSLVVSGSCDGNSSKPLTLDTGANVTVNSGVVIYNDAGGVRNVNGDTVSILSSATSSTITNYGEIQTGSQWGVMNNGVLTSLTNFGTISSGARRGVANNGTITTLTNVGSISGPFADVTNTRTIQTIDNLQGAGNASGALTYAGPLPTNYNIIINSTSTYGRLSGGTGTMAFNVYGNTGTTLVTGVSASTVSIGTYTDVLQGFSSLTGITGTSGTYGGLQYSLVADSFSAGNWNLVFTSSAHDITSGSSGSTADLGTILNPKLDGGTLQVAAAGTIAAALTITTRNGTIDQNGLASTFSGIISNDSAGQAGKLIIANSGSGGSVTLSGVNTYTGGTEVDVGANLRISSSAALASGTLALVGSASVPATLSTTATMTIGNAITVSGDPVFNVSPNTTTTISSPITDGSGPGDVVVQGGGTLQLTAINTYTGLTSIVAGSTLALSGSGAIASSSSLTNSGAFNIAAAGNTVTLGGAYTQGAGGSLVMRAAAGAVQHLSIAGAATLGGSLTLDATAGSYAPGRYVLLTARGGVSNTLSLLGNLGSVTSLGYQLTYDANDVYLLLTPNLADTQASLANTAAAVQGVLALQNASLVNGMSYDCSVFAGNGVCVSVGGRRAVVANRDLTDDSGILIGGFRIDKHLRIGGYVDQGLSANRFGVAVLQGNVVPAVGAFAAWSEAPDGTGAEVKISAGYSKRHTRVSRPIVNTSEPGSGYSALASRGVQLVGKYGLAVAARMTVVPYAGLRYTSSRMDGYAEQDASATAPLTYNSINTSATTAIVGVETVYKVNSFLTLLGSVGLENDLKTSNGSYSSIGLAGLTPVRINPSPVTLRPAASLATYFDIADHRRLDVTGFYRQEAFRSVRTMMVMATYKMGF